jgi:deoxyribonuclease-1
MKLPKIPLSTLRKILRRSGLPGLFFAMLLAPFLLFSENPMEDLGFNSPGATQPSVTPVDTPVLRGPAVDAFNPPAPYTASDIDRDRGSWSWERAKRLSASQWDRTVAPGQKMSSFYCGCDISRRGDSGGDIDFRGCGYVPRKSESRASRLEWEHVVPAAEIGKGRSCWESGAPQCVKDGEPFKGRSCCEIADPAFAMAATDPVNLVPSVGEVNGDRSNFPYGEIPGTGRLYGQCTMEIDWTRDVAEPPDAVKGDVARIWSYMSRSYGLRVSREQADLFIKWMKIDPVSQQEIDVNRQIRASGHRANPLVLSTP